MLNNSNLSTILYHMEHLFNGPSSMGKSSSATTKSLFDPSNDVLADMSLNDDFAQDLDRYLSNTDQQSDSSPASCASLPSSSVSYTQPASASSQFQFILNALTASSARINEETTTYLNQGQPYEIKFCDNSNKRDACPTIYRSVLRLCFCEKTLQQQERELMQKWLTEYHQSTLFDIDRNLTYGILSIIRSNQMPNAIEIVWDTATTTSLFLRFKCTSTDFAHKRHGGEKGIPLRLQIDTYQGNHLDQACHLHACCCKIQLFRLKGAQRKNKADQMRIEKLDFDQRRRYQTTLEHTVLKPCLMSPLYTQNLLSLSYPPDDLSDTHASENLSTDDVSIESIDQQHEQSTGAHDTPPSRLENNYPEPVLPETNGLRELNYITVHSSNEEVLLWLENNYFSAVLDRFRHFRGVDLLRLSLHDIRRICNDDHSMSIRLFNQVNETSVPPLKTLFIKTTQDDAYSAIYLHGLTRRELQDRLSEFVPAVQERCLPLLLELNRIRVKIDNDNVVKYSLPNEGLFYVKTSPSEIVLCLINSAT